VWVPLFCDGEGRERILETSAGSMFPLHEIDVNGSLRLALLPLFLSRTNRRMTSVTVTRILAKMRMMTIHVM
jgi:hypothetical protein